MNEKTEQELELLYEDIQQQRRMELKQDELQYDYDRFGGVGDDDY